MEIEVTLNNELETKELAAKLVKLYAKPITIYLCGELGAGKTTFAQGFLRALGYQHNVKSPTFTIVEPYYFAEFNVYHFDLYRLGHPTELEYIGIRDYLEEKAYFIFEWPNKGAGSIPESDLEIEFQVKGEGRVAILRDNKTNIISSLS